MNRFVWCADIGTEIVRKPICLDKRELYISLARMDGTGCEYDYVRDDKLKRIGSLLFRFWYSCNAHTIEICNNTDINRAYLFFFSNWYQCIPFQDYYRIK